MNIIDKVIAVFDPRRARMRIQERAALNAFAEYDAAKGGSRGKGFRSTRTDADGAAKQRARLSFITRDLFRNNAYALRGQMVIANNVVGDGIIPKVTGQKRAQKALQEKVRKHLDTTAIDADGRLNLYGLQRLAMNAIVSDGEVLIRRRRRDASDGLALPLQIQVMEIDYLASSRDGVTDAGTVIREGIEFDQIGRRVAYHLHSEHPGATGWRLKSDIRRVPASEIIHVYRVDRPGQARGVSWIAPVALRLQDLADYQDAQLMRQKIAACFAAFIKSPENDTQVGADGSSDTGGDKFGLSASIIPGRIQKLAPGEELEFVAPPGVEAYDEFTRGILRECAAGLGITYEALTGDLGNVNFSSGRMGRMEMDRTISAWQWLMMIPCMLMPIGDWVIEAFQLAYGRAEVGLDWVPPHRVLIDPTREIPALADKVRAGFASRSSVVRELGYDPEQVVEEIAEDQRTAEALKLTFDTDVGAGAAARPKQVKPVLPDEEQPKTGAKDGGK